MIENNSSKSFETYRSDAQAVINRAAKYVMDKSLSSWYPRAKDLIKTYNDLSAALIRLDVKIKMPTYILDKEGAQIKSEMDSLMLKMNEYISDVESVLYERVTQNIKSKSL